MHQHRIVNSMHCCQYMLLRDEERSNDRFDFPFLVPDAPQKFELHVQCVRILQIHAGDRGNAGGRYFARPHPFPAD